MELNWLEFKTFVDSRSLFVQWTENSKFYSLSAYDGPMCKECKIWIDDPANEDQEDFETNYKDNGNKKLSDPKDSDGSPLQRVKITTTGWHYQLHGIEFESTKLNSIYSKKVDGTDYGFSTLKFYKSVSSVDTLITGNDLNQDYLDANCIKTVIEWEPNHDVEIIGGLLKQIDAPSEDVRLWVVGVPDIPAAYGGSKPFVVNTNMKFIGTEEGIRVDGRAPKYLQYNATYHTTKMQLIFRHPAGFKHKMHMVFELFKS